MKITHTDFPEVLIVEPSVFGDTRGFFYESFNKKAFYEVTGLNLNFVQENHSHSVKNVLRGLHYQVQNPQGKLVRVVQGEVFDVAVDIRKESPTFGKWVSQVLSAENMRQMWIPEGFAHGFLVMSEAANVLYKTTDYYAPQFERCISWNDPALAIQWPINRNPNLSAKDQLGSTLHNAEVFK